MREELRRTLMDAFYSVLRKTNLPPITILRLAAMGVGSVYREVAEAHLPPNPCPCGWVPHEAEDIALLQEALCDPGLAGALLDLSSSPAAGTA